MLLGQVKIPLILPAVDIGNGCVHVLKSNYDPTFTRDYKVRVSDAVLASCSAPTYFDPIVIDDKYRLVDGGLWANNPSLVATIDAKYRLNNSSRKYSSALHRHREKAKYSTLRVRENSETTYFVAGRAGAL